MKVHIPVLLQEVIAYLKPAANENFVDGTVGEGGHALAILEKTLPEGKVLGIDLDPEQVKNSAEHLVGFKSRTMLVHDSYRNIKEIVTDNNFGPVAGILVDVGMSSWQLEGSEKGFSFQKDQPLDMRYNPEQELTAATIINEYTKEDLETIINEYGEEKFARQITKAIVETRSKKAIESTFALKEVIEKAVPGKYQHGHIHPATRTFQALRIAVNGELENLQKFLPDALSVLSSGGRLVVISFHSLEDRIVKQFFKEKEVEGVVEILTKKPVSGLPAEIMQNPRARSAKLRAIRKL